MFIRTRVGAKSHNKWNRVSKHANACLLLKPVFNQNTTSCVQFMLYCNHNTQVTNELHLQKHMENFIKHKLCSHATLFTKTLWLVCINQTKFSNSFAKLKNTSKHQCHYKSCFHNGALKKTTKM